MNLYTHARKYIDVRDLRHLIEEKIKKRNIAEVQKQQGIILDELKKIEIETSPKFSNWRRDLREGMTTGAMLNTTLEPSDTSLENIDISDNTESSSNASVTSGGSGTGYNTGLNMGAEMISISGAHSSSKTFTLGTVDTSKATTITFKSLQGDYTNGGMANTENTNVFFQDENGGVYLIKTIESNYVGYFVHSGEDHPDHPFKAGLFATMSASQEADLRSDYSDWVGGGFQADVQFQIFGKIVSYLGDQQQTTTHTYNIPSSARGKGKVIITQASNNGSSWTNDIGFSNFEVKRDYPISVIVGLDDPEAVSFIRTDPTMQGLSAAQREKKLLEMLEAGDEYLLKQLGIVGSSARPEATKDPVSWEQAQLSPRTEKQIDDMLLKGLMRGDYGSGPDIERQIRNLKRNQQNNTPGGMQVQGNKETQIAWEPGDPWPSKDGPLDGPQGPTKDIPWVPEAPKAKRKSKKTNMVAHHEPQGEVLSEKRKLKKVKDISKKIPGYYDGKPSPVGFPMDEPPKMVNGFHPDLVDGKKVADRFNKMDPISARSMPATGNPHIDKKVKAAAKKPK